MTPSTVTPTSGAIVATISGSDANRARAAVRIVGAERRSRAIRTRPASAAGHPPRRRRARRRRARRRSGRGRAATAGVAADAARSSAARIAASVLGPIPRTSRRRPPRAASRSSLGGADAERGTDLDRAPRTEAVESAESGQLRRDRPAQLLQLGDRARARRARAVWRRCRARSREARGPVRPARAPRRPRATPPRARQPGGMRAPRRDRRPRARAARRTRAAPPRS